MKELRECIRYSVKSGFKKSVFVEIEGVMKLKAVILDLSAGGFSFTFDMNIISEPDFALEKFLFIRIDFDKFKINAEVEKRWSLINHEDNHRIYTAGFSFKIISNEDRLRLDEIIKYLRSLPSSSH